MTRMERNKETWRKWNAFFFLFFFFSFRDEFTIQSPKDTTGYTDIIFFFAVKKVGNSVNDSCCIFGKFAMDIIISPPFSAKLYHV